MFRYVVYALLLFSCASTTWAFDVNSEALEDVVNVTPFLKTVEQDSFESPPDFSQIKPYQGEELHRFYTEQTLWMSLDVTNSADFKKRVFLYFSAPLTGHVDLFQSVGGQLKLLSVSGSARPLSKRGEPSVHTSFLLKLMPGVTNTYVLRLKTHHLLYSEVLISSEPGFIRSESLNINVFVFYLGVFFALFIYNLFFYFKLKDPLYLAYCVFALMTMMSFCLVNGVGDYLIDLKYFTLSHYLLSFTAMAGISAIAFTYMFLDLHTAPGWIKGILAVLLVSLGFHVIVGLFPNIPWLVIMFGNSVDITVVLTVLMLVLLSFYGLYRHHPMSQWLFASWIVMALSVAAWYLMNYGIIDHNVWTQNVLLWGHLLEMGVITFALTSRFSILLSDSHLKTEYANEKTKYQSLYRVLAHDVSNFVQIINAQVLKTTTKGKSTNFNEVEFSKVKNVLNKIYQVLELTKAQENLILKDGDIELSHVNIGQCVREAGSLVEEELKTKNIELQMDLVQLNQSVVAEVSSLLSEVLLNVLRNSMKFSPDGSKIKVLAEAMSENRLEIKIVDEGVGLSMEQLKTFEDEGHLVSKRGINGERGTGLGLSIILGYMKMYGGDFKLHSEGEGCGTTACLFFKTQ